MEKNSKEKSLVNNDQISFFSKIKNFFKNLFKKSDIPTVEDVPDEVSNLYEKEKDAFIARLRQIDNEEILLLKLQKKYHNKEITEDQLTDNRIESLCKLYDKQIADLKKSNTLRFQKLAYQRLQPKK